MAKAIMFAPNKQLAGAIRTANLEPLVLCKQCVSAQVEFPETYCEPCKGIVEFQAEREITDRWLWGMSITVLLMAAVLLAGLYWIGSVK